MPRKTKRVSRLKIREWSLGLVGAGTLALCMMALPLSAKAISLKTSSIVEDNTITLGDLFTGLEGGADKVLGAAPQPGQEMVLNASTLMRIATALDLPWRPSGPSDQVVLKRAASIVEPETIQNAIKDALAGQKLPGIYEASFPTPPARIILPPEMEAGVEVVSMKADTQNKRFEAVLAAPSKENPAEQITISGALQEMIEVPVLKEALQNGAVVSDADIDFITIRAEAVNHDTLLKTEDMIGKTPRRMALAGKPLKDNDLIAPQAIKRGEMVTMVFSAGGLSLTAKGKAMQGGAKGDVVRVVNASSSKTVEGIITGEREVTVQSF